MSFDVAMRQLGGQSLALNQAYLQVGRGEPIAGTAKVVSRYVDAIMIRANRHATLTEYAENATVPVINGLTDRTHPCQIIADIMTFEEAKGPIEGRRIAWSGDGNNVAASWVHAAAQFKFKLAIACPPQLNPANEVLAWAKGVGAEILLTDDPHEAVTDADCVVTDTWVSMGQQNDAPRRKQLLAAFNGGFRLSAGAGGYEQEGHVVSPLLSGYASLIIDRSGRARIGVWGYGAPARDEAVYSVRQNLRLLVEHGRPTPAAADPSVWGATLGGGAYVARSAVGEDAAGDLLFAGSMSAVPEDLAVALARQGARVAMELDINPQWVQLDAASRPGGPLHAEIPGQSRPAGQFLWGWTRDYFTVVANS